MATNLREVARRIEKAALRFTEDYAPQDSLYQSVNLNAVQVQDVALQDAIIKYTRDNWKKIGDISFAWGLIKLVRLASVRTV
jgi:hypothetical protein